MLVVAGVLLAVECFLRVFQESLSNDIKNIKHISAVREDLQKNSSARKILFLGNSLTLKDLDMEVMNSKLSEQGCDSLWTAKVVADGTTSLEWYLIFQKYFVHENAIPDIVVIGFARTHLEDRSKFNMQRIGGLYCGKDEILELFRDYVHSFGDRTAFFLALTSSTFSNSDRIQGYVLYKCIPNYLMGLNKIRNVLLVDNETETQGQANECKALKRLITLFQEKGVFAVFVAMPIIETWEIKPGQVKIIEEMGMKIIDCRDAKLIPSLHFRDRVHLNKRGAEIFTSMLSKRLVDVMSQSGYDIRKHQNSI